MFRLASLAAIVVAVTGSPPRSLTEAELRELGRSVRACRLLERSTERSGLSGCEIRPDPLSGAAIG